MRVTLGAPLLAHRGPCPAPLSTTPRDSPRDGEARRGSWRPVVSGLLITVAALLAPLAVLATWADGQIQDTDRYLETVAPLANDPDVQDAIAVRIEQVIFTYVDLDAAADELVTALDRPGLPPAAASTLRAFAGPLADGVRKLRQRPGSSS
ncbi:hypothetical protein [Aeromicrobium sp. UC242_57]|uniref:hypothetical protein n=1 Tax=Aeromicrobium sp. UC242_57 TaxID=3374624 RepID=UPI00379F9F2C